MPRPRASPSSPRFERLMRGGAASYRSTAFLSGGQLRARGLSVHTPSPFGLADWRNPNTGEWERTFAIITVPSNSLVEKIHDRMPAVLKPTTYARWLSSEPDPYDLLITYPSEPMTMWPI